MLVLVWNSNCEIKSSEIFNLLEAMDDDLSPIPEVARADELDPHSKELLFNQELGVGVPPELSELGVKEMENQGGLKYEKNLFF